MRIGLAFFTVMSFIFLLSVEVQSAGLSPLYLPLLSHAEGVATVYFDESDADTMLLGNDYYEVGLDKSNGAITYIVDKATGGRVTEGSRNGCLWGAVFDDATPSYVGGCAYNAAWANAFSYEWEASHNRLRLLYEPDVAAGQQVTAQVTITASVGAWFDMALTLENGWGSELDFALFPSDLIVREAGIEQVVLPALPGVVLEPTFFDENRSYVGSYPAPLFADYMALSSTLGQMSIYALYQEPIKPVFLGFIHDDGDVNDSSVYYHSFSARVADGEGWHSPRIRLHIGQAVSETIAAYRVDNGLHEFASLADKLGSRYEEVSQAPLFKADASGLKDQLGIGFSDYASALFPRIPAPAIFHPVTFWAADFDEHYPDFLPTDAAYGTRQEFVTMFEEAQTKGLLVMPYINPTWWDDESPTLQNLTAPLTINDLAVLDDEGNPVYEYYGVHGGYVMSPYAPFVQARVDEVIDELTIDVPSDMLFEDQIGARPALPDYNSASPYLTAYPEGWLAHTRTYYEHLLMTEGGFDRLAETEAGFHGGVLLSERSGATDGWWGANNWHPYPLATMMARDKTFFYQHDLAHETMTIDKETLTWNLAAGYMLSHDLYQSSFGGGLDSQWLTATSAFQQHLLADYASELVTDFRYLAEDVTQTSFESVEVIANWDESNAYTVSGYTLPPQGVLVRERPSTRSPADTSVIGGIFTYYNNQPLTAGDHYLIEERGTAEIIVRQPIGADTNLTLALLESWESSDQIVVRAYDVAGILLGDVAASVDAQAVTFTYQQQLAGQNVGYYRLTNTALPPVESPARLSIYYGWPSLVNGASGDVEQAATVFEQFDIVVFGDGLEHPSHGDHDKTAEIIAKLSLAGTEVYGYVDMGVSTQNLPLATAQQYVDEWAAMGVTGIFWDDAGYDYGVDRTRQNALIDYTHAQGLRAFVNAWEPDDLFADDPDATHLTTGDLYLAESWLVGHEQYRNLEHWTTKSEKLINYREETGVRMVGLSTGEVTDDLTWPSHPYQMAWWGAVLYALDAFGYTSPEHSASGDHANQVLLPPLPSNTYGNHFTDSSVTHLLENGYHKRNTDQGEIGIGGDGSSWGLGYYRAASNPLYSAIYYGNQGWAISDLQAQESWAGKKNSVVVLFTSLSQAFPTSQLENLWANGNTPLITLEPHGYTAAQLANGDADAIITQWAEDFKSWTESGGSRAAFLRFAHEMNGNWYDWAGDPSSYIAGWQHIHDIFTSQGLNSNHLQWVWCVNNADIGAPTAESYYPGDNYVDWLAIDGYNWGQSQPNATWDSWQPFVNLFDPMLKRLNALAPDKPLLLAEMGSTSVSSTTTQAPAREQENEQGISDPALKAQWVGQSYLLATKSYPQLKLAAYFNEDKAGPVTLVSGESDWAIFNNGTQDNRWGIPPAEFEANKRIATYSDAMQDDTYLYQHPLTSIFETPLAVQLSNFSAIQEGSGVKISWQTVSELNNLGFNLYRNTTPTSPQPLNQSLIPSQGPGSGQAFAYHWVDNTVQTGVTYYYWVEDVDTNGTITQHGPVSVSTNVPTALTVEEMTQEEPKRLVLALLALIILVGAMAVLGSRYGNFFGRAA